MDSAEASGAGDGHSGQGWNTCVGEPLALDRTLELPKLWLVVVRFMLGWLFPEALVQMLASCGPENFLRAGKT